ncbi:peptidoglycan recognition protein family protein [Virgibacillus ndiopensis]|uniref:peptidoglycan recognition protein family protein n=1 Tax=Virgibacillus ndiopensis TaxID=2004408 RepID=UPI000C07CCDB|nr:N-acetylmuramoyl-L-alanine amidase [Virgibacillus ndiopensis]
MVKIIKRFIPESQIRQRPGFYMNPQFITIHNTANDSKGADAEMHSRYLLNGASGRYTSWHFTVDDEVIYQHLPIDEAGWHAGDGENGPGNRKSIGIEICENANGDFQKAVANAQWLVRKLMKEHSICIDNVVPHKHWSGKNCPHLLLNVWSTFIDGIKEDEQQVVDRNEQVKSHEIENDDDDLIIDGKWGPKTTRKAQKHFGTKVDGEISGQPVNFSTKNIPSVEFGEGGSDLIEAMQIWAKTPVDRILTDPSRLIEYMQERWKMLIVDKRVSFPSEVVKEFQRRLNEGNL